MSEYINNELIENTYLFYIKRVANSDMAKDLAHDILLEALKAVSKGKTFINFYGWYWRMAHNKYANYMEYKKTQTPPCLNNIVVSWIIWFKLDVYSITHFYIRIINRSMNPNSI